MNLKNSVTPVYLTLAASGIDKYGNKKVKLKNNRNNYLLGDENQSGFTGLTGGFRKTLRAQTSLPAVFKNRNLKAQNLLTEQQHNYSLSSFEELQPKVSRNGKVSKFAPSATSVAARRLSKREGLLCQQPKVVVGRLTKIDVTAKVQNTSRVSSVVNSTNMSLISSLPVEKIINQLMRDGKKTKASQIFYKTLALITEKILQENESLSSQHSQVRIKTVFGPGEPVPLAKPTSPVSVTKKLYSRKNYRSQVKLKFQSNLLSDKSRRGELSNGEVVRTVESRINPLQLQPALATKKRFVDLMRIKNGIVFTKGEVIPRSATLLQRLAPKVIASVPIFLRDGGGPKTNQETKALLNFVKGGYSEVSNFVAAPSPNRVEGFQETSSFVETNKLQMEEPRRIGVLPGFFIDKGKFSSSRFSREIIIGPTSSLTQQALDLIASAIYNVKPSLDVRQVRIAGMTYQVPNILDQKKSINQGVRWIIEAARMRQSRTKNTFSQCLADEFLEAFQKQGKARQKRDHFHNLALTNRAYVRFRWW